MAVSINVSTGIKCRPLTNKVRALFKWAKLYPLSCPPRVRTQKSHYQRDFIFDYALICAVNRGFVIHFYIKREWS